MTLLDHSSSLPSGGGVLDRSHSAGEATAAAPSGRRRLAWLAVGTFALGTENLVVGAMLTSIATDLGTTVAAAGLLISVFALSYAVAAPVIGSITSRRAPKRVLMVALIALAVIDVLAATAPSMGWLVLGRAVAAIAAAAYTPNALALAGSAVAPEERGRATALVYAGLAAATLVGVPVASLIANTVGWRTTFAGVGLIAAVAAIGVARRLPAVPRREPVSVRDWLTVVRLGDVRGTLALTFAVYSAQFVAFAFIAPVIDGTTRSNGGWIPLALLAFGLAAIVGNQFGGVMTDRWGADRVAISAQVLMAVGLLGLTLLSVAPVGDVIARVGSLVAMAVWGLGAWSFNPPQQVRLLSAGGSLGPLALAANSTALYGGIAAGGLIGSLVSDVFGTDALGLAGAAILVGTITVEWHRSTVEKATVRRSALPVRPVPCG